MWYFLVKPLLFIITLLTIKGQFYQFVDSYAILSSFMPFCCCNSCHFCRLQSHMVYYYVIPLLSAMSFLVVIFIRLLCNFLASLVPFCEGHFKFFHLCKFLLSSMTFLTSFMPFFCRHLCHFPSLLMPFSVVSYAIFVIIFWNFCRHLYNFFLSSSMLFLLSFGPFLSLSFMPLFVITNTIFCRHLYHFLSSLSLLFLATYVIFDVPYVIF